MRARARRSALRIGGSGCGAGVAGGPSDDDTGAAGSALGGASRHRFSSLAAAGAASPAMSAGRFLASESLSRGRVRWACESAPGGVVSPAIRAAIPAAALIVGRPGPGPRAPSPPFTADVSGGVRGAPLSPRPRAAGRDKLSRMVRARVRAPARRSRGGPCAGAGQARDAYGGGRIRSGAVLPPAGARRLEPRGRLLVGMGAAPPSHATPLSFSCPARARRAAPRARGVGRRGECVGGARARPRAAGRWRAFFVVRKRGFFGAWRVFGARILLFFRKKERMSISVCDEDQFGV